MDSFSDSGSLRPTLYMTLQLGTTYTVMNEEEERTSPSRSPPAAMSGNTTELTALMQMFLQDRQRLQYMEQELAAERRRRDRDMEEWVGHLQEQIAALELRGRSSESTG